MSSTEYEKSMIYIIMHGLQQGLVVQYKGFILWDDYHYVCMLKEAFESLIKIPDSQ